MSSSSIPRGRRQLAHVGLFSIAVFVVALLLLNLFAFPRPPSFMSQFANSRFGAFWLLGLYTMIVGTALLGWALQPCLQACGWKSAGLVMLGLAWIGAVTIAVFPVDAVPPYTLHGTIHDDAAFATFVLLGAAMMVLAPAFRSSPNFTRLAGASLTLGLLVTMAWIANLTTTLLNLAGRGAAQRVLVFFIVTWFTLIALRLRQLPAPYGKPSRAGHTARSRNTRESTHLSRIRVVPRTSMAQTANGIQATTRSKARRASV